MYSLYVAYIWLAHSLHMVCIWFAYRLYILRIYFTSSLCNRRQNSHPFKDWSTAIFLRCFFLLYLNILSSIPSTTNHSLLGNVTSCGTMWWKFCDNILRRLLWLYLTACSVSQFSTVSSVIVRVILPEWKRLQI